jgi:hypothetical protein
MADQSYPRVFQAARTTGGVPHQDQAGHPGNRTQDEKAQGTGEQGLSSNQLPLTVCRLDELGSVFQHQCGLASKHKEHVRIHFIFPEQEIARFEVLPLTEVGQELQGLHWDSCRQGDLHEVR